MFPRPSSRCPSAQRRRSAARALRPVLGAALAGVAFAACYDQPFVPDVETDGRLTVTNDESLLAARVEYPELAIGVGADAPAPAAGLGAAPPALAPSSITLTLIAEIDPPRVDGETLQATSVWANRDDRAIVSYGMRGATALGALDWFMSLRSKRPKLRSSVSFADADVSAVFTDGKEAFAVGASSDLALSAPAVMERFRVQGDHFRIDEDGRTPLSSFVGTSATSTEDVLYATSGDAGGVFAFDRRDLRLLGEYPLDDARWVAWDEDGDRVVVLQGTPGRLAVFRADAFSGGSMQLLNTFPVPGVDVAESKSTVEVAGGKAFVAAGPEGVQIVCLDTGAIVGSVPIPDPAALGLDPSVVVANAVTVDDDLMFISNGEAGVYAAAAERDFEASPCGETQKIQVLGRLQFDALQSVNHVVYRDGFLFVAAGLGGIKVVDVSTR